MVMKICLFGDARSVHIQRLAPGLVDRGLAVHVVTHKPADIPGATVERFRIPGPSLQNLHRWRGRWQQYLQGFLRRFDVVNVHFLTDWGMTPELMQDGCVVASPWGSDIVEPPGEDPPSPSLTEARLLLLTHAKAVTVFGPTFARTVAAFANIDVHTIKLLPLGVDLSLFSPTGALKAGNSALRVGFLKGFRAVYGPTYLIRAIPLILRRRPRTQFDLIGDGAQLEECKVLAGELDVLPAIQWIARQPHHLMPRWLERWDLTVIPSVCEAFGVAALESSAMQVPVIASRVGGLPDTVLDGETGLLVPEKSPDALAAAVVDLLGDAPRRLRMGRAGRRWVRKEYDWQKILDDWVSTYQQALDQASVMV